MHVQYTYGVIPTYTHNCTTYCLLLKQYLGATVALGLKRRLYKHVITVSINEMRYVCYAPRLETALPQKCEYFCRIGRPTSEIVEATESVSGTDNVVNIKEIEHPKSRRHRTLKRILD